jgi:5-methylcytosine-specific restriction endonuclease McrA
MGLDRWTRHSRAVLKSRRWQSLRLEALRRDGWQCVQCGSRVRLEVDHIRPVRMHPELAFDLGNLQVLCAQHHTQKTRKECGHPELNPKRQAWRELLNKELPNVDLN